MSTTHGSNDEPAITASAADALYALAASRFGPALQRPASGYEWRAAERQDLLQDTRLQLWRSLAGFDGRCSLKTWVYRLTHNVAADHVRRSMRGDRALSLEDMEQAGNQVPVWVAVINARAAGLVAGDLARLERAYTMPD